MSDYDYNPREKPSAYLRLKKQGDKVTIRLCSSPYREPVVWELGNTKPLEEDVVREFSEDKWAEIYRDPDFEVNEAFHWEVIDRDDGLAKIFSGTPGIYKSIKEYAEIEAWGDPQTYDFQIERTEDPGRAYYKVTPLPNRNEMTQREMQLLTELKFSEKKPMARKLSERQADYMRPELTDPEGTIHNENAAPAAAIAQKREEDVPIYDIPDKAEDINLDDIPFGGADNPPLNPNPPVAESAAEER